MENLDPQFSWLLSEEEFKSLLRGLAWLLSLDRFGVNIKGESQVDLEAFLKITEPMLSILGEYKPKEADESYKASKNLDRLSWSFIILRIMRNATRELVHAKGD